MFLCLVIEVAVLICCATGMLSSVNSMHGNRSGMKGMFFMQCYAVDVHLNRKIIYSWCIRPFKSSVADTGWKAKRWKPILQGQA